MQTHEEFVQSLKVGDPVIIVEGFTNIDGGGWLTKVTAITPEYIQTEEFPGFQFHRQTGKQLPPRGGGTRNKYLLCPEEQKLLKNHKEYEKKTHRLA